MEPFHPRGVMNGDRCISFSAARAWSVRRSCEIARVLEPAHHRRQLSIAGGARVFSHDARREFCNVEFIGRGAMCSCATSSWKIAAAWQTRARRDTLYQDLFGPEVAYEARRLAQLIHQYEPNVIVDCINTGHGPSTVIRILRVAEASRPTTQLGQLSMNRSIIRDSRRCPIISPRSGQNIETLLIRCRRLARLRLATQNRSTGAMSDKRNAPLP